MRDLRPAEVLTGLACLVIACTLVDVWWPQDDAAEVASFSNEIEPYPGRVDFHWEHDDSPGISVYYDVGTTSPLSLIAEERVQGWVLWQVDLREGTAANPGRVIQSCPTYHLSSAIHDLFFDDYKAGPHMLDFRLHPTDRPDDEPDGLRVTIRD